MRWVSWFIFTNSSVRRTRLSLEIELLYKMIVRWSNLRQSMLFNNIDRPSLSNWLVAKSKYKCCKLERELNPYPNCYNPSLLMSLNLKSKWRCVRHSSRNRHSLINKHWSTSIRLLNRLSLSSTSWSILLTFYKTCLISLGLHWWLYKLMSIDSTFYYALFFLIK